MVQFENIHAGRIKGTKQVIFRKINVYTYVYMHVINISEQSSHNCEG